MSNNNTILEKVEKEIEQIRPNLAKGDLKKCSKAVGITIGNVSLYMNGKGSNPDTAISILTFLRKIVSQREKAIA